MKKAPHKIVEVAWVDSESNPDWDHLKNVVSDGTLECRSVGYLLAEKSDRIVLAASLGRSLGTVDDDVVASHITVPKVCIIELQELTKKTVRSKKTAQKELVKEFGQQTT